VNGWLDLSVRLRRHARGVGEPRSSSSSGGGGGAAALFFDGSFRASLDGQLNDLRCVGRRFISSFSLCLSLICSCPPVGCKSTKKN
jgi:hypothetical protein